MIQLDKEKGSGMCRDKYLSYRDKLYSQLDKLRMDNGTFRASNSLEYNATWIRDSYYNNMAYLNYDNEKYLQTCHTYLDFLHKWENQYDHKITWLTKQLVTTHEEGYKFIHPKVNFDGSEIHGLEWEFRQQDSFPYLILMMWNGYNIGLPVFRNDSDRVVMQLLIKAMEHTRYWEVEYAASWEEECSVFMSNLLLSIYATEKAYEMRFDIDRECLKKARLKAYEQFPYERKGKEWDLTLLFPCILDGAVAKIDIEDIVQGCVSNLQKGRYMCRYQNDIYKPFRKQEDLPKGEMEWCMSGGFLSMIHSSFGNVGAARHYIDFIMMEYPDGDIPEGVNEYGKRCFNEVLAWSVSMYIQAINKWLAINR